MAGQTDYTSNYMFTKYFFLIFYFFFCIFLLPILFFFSFDLFFFQFYSRFGSEIEHQPNSPHINFTNCVYLSLSILSTSVVWYKDHWIDLVHFMFHFYCDYCLCIFFFVFFPCSLDSPFDSFFSLFISYSFGHSQPFQLIQTRQTTKWNFYTWYIELSV